MSSPRREGTSVYDVGFSALKGDGTGAFNALTTADEKLKRPLTRAVDLRLISTVQMATVALPLHLYKGWSGSVVFTLWPTCNLCSLLSLPFPSIFRRIFRGVLVFRQQVTTTARCFNLIFLPIEGQQWYKGKTDLLHRLFPLYISVVGSLV